MSLCGATADVVAAHKREIQRRFYAANRAKVTAKLRSRYASGADRRRELQREYYAKNRERIIERNRVYYNEHKADLVARQLKRDAARRDDKAQYMRGYYADRAALGLVKDRVITEAQWAKFARAMSKSKRGNRTVHNDKMIQFVKRWRDLDKRQADIDHERSTLCREIRSQFDSGPTGDDKFLDWCALELGLPLGPAQDALSRAAASKVVPDSATWKKLGGFRQIRHVAAISDKRQQVAVLEAAKASGKAISTIIRERSGDSPERINPRADAEALAAYVEGLAAAITALNVPKHITAIVERYRPATKRRAA